MPFLTGAPQFSQSDCSIKDSWEIMGHTFLRVHEHMQVRIVFNIIREHGSVSLCRDGQKTKWRLQCKY